MTVFFGTTKKDDDDDVSVGESVFCVDESLKKRERKSFVCVFAFRRLCCGVSFFARRPPVLHINRSPKIWSSIFDFFFVCPQSSKGSFSRSTGSERVHFGVKKISQKKIDRKKGNDDFKIDRHRRPPFLGGVPPSTTT